MIQDRKSDEAIYILLVSLLMASVVGAGLFMSYLAAGWTGIAVLLIAAMGCRAAFLQIRKRL